MAKVKKKELGKGIRALLSNMDEQGGEPKEEMVKELAHSVAMIRNGMNVIKQAVDLLNPCQIPVI